MITSSQRLVVLIGAARSSNGATGVSSIVAGAVVVGGRDTKTARRRWDSSDLGVTKGVVAALPLPELDTRALGVAVGGARAESFLLLVVAAKEELEQGGDEEEDGSEDGDGEAGRVQAAGSAERNRVGDLTVVASAVEALLVVGGSVAQGSVDVSRAAVSTVAGQDSVRNHGTAAKDIEDHAEEGEEGLSTQAASENHGEDSVENHGTRETSYGLLPCRDGDIAVSLDGHKIRVDAENNASTAEFNDIEGCRAELQGSAAETHRE